MFITGYNIDYENVQSIKKTEDGGLIISYYNERNKKLPCTELRISAEIVNGWKELFIHSGIIK